jgi:hypothetical protein
MKKGNGGFSVQVLIGVILALLFALFGLGLLKVFGIDLF